MTSIYLCALYENSLTIFYEPVAFSTPTTAGKLYHSAMRHQPPTSQAALFKINTRIQIIHKTCSGRMPS